ncbi:MAG TPA: chloride channel protein [Acidimicrobiales bacterium]
MRFPKPNEFVRSFSAAVVVGVSCGIALFAFEGAVHRVERVVYEWLPERLEVDDITGWYSIVVLTVAGLLVGLVLRFAPGHGGHDPATEGLFGEPLPLGSVPGLVGAALITLGAGVSLGPEAPLLGSATAVLAFVAHRRGTSGEGLVMLGAAAMLGALFGAPIGAAFAFLEMMPSTGKALFDRFVPLLVAATSGALTVTLIAARPRLFAPFPPARDFMIVDVLSAAALGALGALVGLLFFPLVRTLYSAARRLPVIVRLAAGGLALGVIAAIVGDLVLFSGQQELPLLVTDAETMSNGRLALLSAGKFLSLALAVAVGFRGGRIFPAVFTGVALGVLVHALVPGIPMVLAAGSVTTGLVLAFTRLWVLTLLMVALIVGLSVTPLLGVAAVAAHVLLKDRPELRPAPAHPT